MPFAVGSSCQPESMLYFRIKSAEKVGIGEYGPGLAFHRATASCLPWTKIEGIMQVYQATGGSRYRDL